MSEDWVEHSPRTEPLQPTVGEYKKCWHVAPPGEILYLLTESWGERKPCLLGHDPIKSGASFTLSWEGADRSSSTTYSLFLPRFSRFPCLYFFFFFIFSMPLVQLSETLKGYLFYSFHQMLQMYHWGMDPWGSPHWHSSSGIPNMHFF